MRDILKVPRTPKYSGTEEISWDDVDKTLNGFLTAWYKTNKKPDDPPKQFKDCAKDIKQWISKHSLLGNPEADIFHDGLVLPVVNPATGKLNRNGLQLARIFTSRVKDITEETKKLTYAMIGRLSSKNFPKKKKRETAVENLCDIVDVLDQFESKTEILTLVKKDKDLNELLQGLDDDAAVEKLKDTLAVLESV